MDENYVIEGTEEYDECKKQEQEALEQKAEESVDEAMGELSAEEIEKLKHQIFRNMPMDRLHSPTKRYISKPLRKKKRKAQKVARRANR